MQRLTITELAEKVGRTRATIYSWIDAGHIPPPNRYLKINGKGQPRAVWTHDAERAERQAMKRASDAPKGGRPPKDKAVGR